jgi:hypothetical protein
MEKATMPIRFAPAVCRTRATKPLLRMVRIHAANDNVLAQPDDAILRAALRHFADHGLAAAEQARHRAEAAFFAGDRDAYRWWLDICRTLDRRMAAAVDLPALSENGQASSRRLTAVASVAWSRSGGKKMPGEPGSA